MLNAIPMNFKQLQLSLLNYIRSPQLKFKWVHFYEMASSRGPVLTRAFGFRALNFEGLFLCIFISNHCICFNDTVQVGLFTVVAAKLIG